MFVRFDVLRCLREPDTLALAATLWLQYIRLILFSSCVCEPLTVTRQIHKHSLHVNIMHVSLYHNIMQVCLHHKIIAHGLAAWHVCLHHNIIAHGLAAWHVCLHHNIIAHGLAAWHVPLRRVPKLFLTLVLTWQTYDLSFS